MKSRFIVRVAIPTLCAVLLHAFPVLADASTAAPAPAATVSAANSDAVLARYQLALDQISAGSLATARVVLEDGIRRFGPQNDLNLLLGYVLQREGKSDAARERLSQVPASPLASRFAAQLQGSETKPQSLENAAPQIVPVATTVAAAAKVPPSVALPQTDARLAKLEADMVELVNAERAKAGLKPLTIDDKLANVARAHSAEMRDKTYFAHESPTAELREPIDRYQSALNERPRVIAENIFRSWGAQRQITMSEIREGHDSLMHSPGHRDNILYAEVTHIGIGFAANGRGDLWITQMFLRP